MSYTDFLNNRANEEAAKLVLLPMAELVARLDTVNEGLEALSDMVAEDASESALFGDGPCGSLARATAYRKMQNEALALSRAIQIAGDVGPKLPYVPNPEEIPF
jgi:hypothetical protein